MTGQTGDAPLLSILVPVYNVEAYVAECIHSIVQQTADLPVEIIMLDDCSSDGSRAIAERIVERNRGQVSLMVHERNRGLSAARNTMLDAARGEYIWFLDSDDTLADGAVAGLAKILEQQRPDLILCDYMRNDRRRIATFDGAERVLLEGREELVRGIFSTRKLHCCFKIARRELWGSTLRFPEGANFEDISMVPQLLLRARSYIYVPEAWVFYRQHAQSITARLAQSRDFDVAGQSELAGALGQFHTDLAQELGGIGRATRYAIAHFQAKLFRQIGYILLKQKLRNPGKISLIRLVAQFRTISEACSPLSFAALLKEYRARREIARFAPLQLFCSLAGLHKSKR